MLVKLPSTRRRGADATSGFTAASVGSALDGEADSCQPLRDDGDASSSIFDTGQRRDADTDSSPVTPSSAGTRQGDNTNTASGEGSASAGADKMGIDKQIIFSNTTRRNRRTMFTMNRMGRVVLVGLAIALKCIPARGGAFLQSSRRSRASSFPETRQARAGVPSLRRSTASSVTRLYDKLWKRLGIEEDEEPMWYLLNCVAGLELDLLRQCREICSDMPDAVKFVVPTVKKTRSHGANRMVTETKVKYLGYVFAKLRLCEEVYEAIQGLDLCRSWMGTVNHKGYKKLPPSPLALNELEIEKFGLEDMDEDEDGDDNDVSEVDADGTGVIVDDEEQDEKDNDDEIQEEVRKVYLGLKVEDMVKITAKGKFYNEDGIVRRLKEGKILVRFYTYGSMYEEWLSPGDVRKLTNIEILKGLSGPSQPITQRDFDDPQQGSRRGYGDRGGGYSDRDSDLRRSFSGGPGAGRNRRQDRVANRYSQDRRGNKDFFGRTDDERHREERNWNWYQDQRRGQQRGNVVATDGNTLSVQSGSGKDNLDKDDWALSDVESQWGRKPQRQQRREGQRQQNRYENRRAEAAIDGADDWSAFVSSPELDEPSASAKSIGGGGKDSDDFFDSLMSDLSKDLGNSGSSGTTKGASDSPTDTASDEDEFFASLMSDLTKATSDDKPKARSRKTSATMSNERYEDPLTEAGGGNDDHDADDFFASLEAELGNAFENNDVSTSRNDEVGSGNDDDGADDFFAKLEAELTPEAIGSDGDPDDLAVAASGEPSSTRSSKATAKRRSSKPEAASSTSAQKADLSKCTVPVLKDMLRERGLKVSGKKSELIERLTTSS